MNLASPARLLLVDDDYGIRTSIGHMLRSRGYSVDLAASGEEALEMAANVAYNLIMLDLTLPDMDGLEVVRQVQAIQPDLAIILFSGHADLENILDFAESELGVAIVRKPASWLEIEQTISQLLQN